MATRPLRTGLVPFDLSRVFPGESLDFDLFNQQGVLVLQRGSRVDDPSRTARLRTMRLYRVDYESAGAISAPVAALQALADRYMAVTRTDRWVNPADLIALSDQLHQLTMDHPSECLGMIRHVASPSPARSKALFVAILGCVVAAKMGFDQGVQRTIIRAAISMNLASFGLQDQLNRQARVPSPEECEELWLHPWRSADLLFRSGVKDMDWLNAVRQHHENLDRSGYPYRIGIDALMPEARILRVTDVFAAMVDGRSNRAGYAPRHAMQVAFERERGRLDDAAMLTLRRVVGRYPPGTLVKLANRETAVVTRWFNNAVGPRFVVSVLRPSGTPMQQPRARNTTAPGYGIRGYASLPVPAPALDWSRIWAQG